MAKNDEVLVPDLGGASDVDVIEVFVKPGDSVVVEDSLITLEGDKATMEVPSPKAGVIKTVNMKVGDKASEGDLILTIASETKESKTEEKAKEIEKKPTTESLAETSKPQKKKEDQLQDAPKSHEKEIETDQPGFGTTVHAGPSVRRIAHEFGVNLTKIEGTGAKSRVLKEDVQRYVKQHLAVTEKGGTGVGMPFAKMPEIDFSQFGEIDKHPLSKIKKISGKNLHRNWVSIPHVTQFGEADITGLESFRQQQKAHALEQGLRLTPIIFVMKAVVAALKKFPTFNASLDPGGEQLILKKYFHIGVAVDTPNGLMVPVIRHVDQKGLYQLAKELGDVSKKAREKGLAMTDMQGGCFTISSLGGIGGTAFTPIINAPEVAILGLSRSEQKPVYQNGNFEPRLMLPLSLSYDHRVIDGAEGARFIIYLSNCLTDIRTLLLY